MDEVNDTPVAATEEKNGTEITPAAAPATEPKPNRAALTDEEQLAVLEGRTKRLKTKLGIKDDAGQSPTSDAELLQKTFLRAAQITAEDEVELALSLSKKWDMPIDKLVDDEDFLAKLEKTRTAKANEIATSGIKASPGSKGAVETPDYWIAKGTPPTADQVPDRKTRAGIVRAMMASASTSGKKFYND